MLSWPRLYFQKSDHITSLKRPRHSCKKPQFGRGLSNKRSRKALATVVTAVTAFVRDRGKSRTEEALALSAIKTGTLLQSKSRD